ncbi:PqqD family peptide modification chaperone [bacterium]|nr:PqqD family peptide modification chaperone [bacterium]
MIVFPPNRQRTDCFCFRKPGCQDMKDVFADKTCFKQSNTVVTRTIVSETILIDITRTVHLPEKGYILLNGVGLFIWSQLGENTTFQDLIESVVGEYDVTVEEANEDTRRFLSELVDHGYAEPVECAHD